MKHLLLFIAAVFLSSISYAQFTISAELRPRAEMNRGAGTLFPDSVAAYNYITQRTRLNFDYNTEKFQMRLSLQDVRVWGHGDVYNPTGIFSYNNGMSIYEGWFRIKFQDVSNLTIGRQMLKYDDQRLIGWRNWNQNGIAYDAVVFSRKKNNWEMNLGVSFNNMANERTKNPQVSNELFDNTNLMRSFNFLRINRKFNDNLNVSFYALGSGFQKKESPGTIYLTGTFGFYGGYKSENFNVNANAYYQTGRAQSGKEVSAYMLTIDPTYKAGNWKFGVGADYLSGDDATSGDDFNKKEKTYNIFYAPGFLYYGWMNYYVYMKSATANGGLVDIYPNVEVTLKPKHKLRSYFHIFSLANPVLINNEVFTDKNIGQELDLMYIYNHSKELTVQAGFSYYFATVTTAALKRVDYNQLGTPYWAWVMLTFKPTLFVSN
jgi:hypothetical protein